MPRYDEKGIALNDIPEVEETTSAIDYKSDPRFTNPAINYAKDPRFIAPEAVASAIDYKNDPRFTIPGIDYAKDPRFVAQEEAVLGDGRISTQDWLAGKDLPDAMPTSDRETVLENRQKQWLSGADLPDQMPSSDKNAVLAARRQEAAKGTSAIDYENDPRFTAPESETPSGIDYASDPRFVAKDEAVLGENKMSTEDWLAGKDLPDQMPTSDRETVLNNRKEQWLAGSDLPEQMPTSDRNEVLAARRKEMEEKEQPAEETTTKEFDREAWLRGDDLPDQMPTSDRETVLENRQKQDAWLQGEDLPDSMPSNTKDEVLAARRKEAGIENAETDFDQEAWLRGDDLPDQMPTNTKEEVLEARRKQYEGETEVLSEEMTDDSQRIEELADEVIKGKYGNGQEREDALGDDYEAVQKVVNERMEKSQPEKDTQPASDAPLTAANGKTFDAKYYAENNPDVVAVYGTDPNKLMQHYNEYGQFEGRKASNEDIVQPTSGLVESLGNMAVEQGDIDLELKDGSVFSIEDNNGTPEYFLDGKSMGTNADAVERKLVDKGLIENNSRNGIDSLIEEFSKSNAQTSVDPMQQLMAIMQGEKTV